MITPYPANDYPDNYSPDNGGPDDNDGPDDYDAGEDGEDVCPWCGGDGTAMYLDSPEAWGEDCPSEEDHLISCQPCGGTGKASQCSVL